MFIKLIKELFVPIIDYENVVCGIRNGLRYTQPN